MAAERVRREAERERASFAAFVRAAWPWAGTTEPLIWGWHLDAACAHLQAVADGEIKRLAINIPPAHGKSKLVSVLFPAWVWARAPESQFLCVTHSAEFAERDSGFCRALIEGEWYRARHQRGWTLKPDQNAKRFWANTREGHRISMGVGGTGARADFEVIDDPIQAVNVGSKAERTAVNDWLAQTLTTRFNDATTGRAVLIMQRLHEEDPTAFVLGGGNWEHLFLPSEFELHRRCVTHRTRAVPANGVPAHEVREEFWRDPRTREGELLFPAKFPQAALDDLKRPNALGEIGFAGQHQQRPMPATGGMFKIADWRFWKRDGFADASSQRPRGCYDGPAAPLPAKLDRVIISVDGTFKKTERGSFVAIHVWGTSGARRLLLDRVHERMDYDECERVLLSVIKRWPEAREKVVEDKANGSMLVNRLTNVLGVSGVIAEPSGSDSKEQRASVYSLPYHRAGNLELPDGAPWLEEYIAEHAAFPLGRTNDDVDAQSQALRHLESEMTSADWLMRAQLF